MLAVEEERLSEINVEFSKGAACCVVMASNGYPQKYDTGFEVIEEELDDNAFIYHAGTKMQDGKIVTSGGRVLGVCATADNLENAIKDAYKAVGKVHFQNSYTRTDIGKKALNILNNK